MKIVHSLLLVLALAGCGHMAGSSNSKPTHVELFDGVEHRYQLRVLYRVTVYEPFPTRRYLSSNWISLDSLDTTLEPELNRVACVLKERRRSPRRTKFAAK